MMNDQSFARLFAGLRSQMNGEDSLKMLEELQRRILEEEKTVERQKRVYEDEISILKEVSNVSGEPLKYKIIDLERELKNLKRENLESKVAQESVNRKNLELKEEVERLERRNFKIQEEAGKLRGQWTWNVETLKEQKEALDRALSNIGEDFKKHVQEWAGTVEMIQQKSSADKALIKDRFFEGLYGFLMRQKTLIANEEKTLLNGLTHFIQNQIGGLGGTAKMLTERAVHLFPPGKKPNVTDLLQLSPQDLRTEMKFIIDVLKDKTEAIDRLDRGLRDLESLNRIPEARPEKTDLADALEEWIAADAEFIAKSRAPIDQILRKTSPVIIDKSLLSLALRELLANAGECREKNAAVQLQTETDPGKTWVGFSFEDNGPGIPEHLKEKVFLPFFTTKAGRPGLGLTKASRWISFMGGELALQPSPRGAKFLARFPVYDSISLETP